jgi:predicted O-methyltransferase YrrM
MNKFYKICFIFCLILLSGFTCNSPEIKPPRGNSPDEKRIIKIADEVRGGMSVSQAEGRLFRVITESTNAKVVVEIGTYNGHSGLWFALGLRKTGGKLITHEIDPDTAKKAQKNFERAGVADLITIVQGDAHKEVTKLKDPIDILFLDADKSGYMDYLKKLLPLVKKGGLILTHNTTFPAPNPKYIKEITSNPALETLFLKLSMSGLGITLKKR